MKILVVTTAALLLGTAVVPAGQLQSRNGAIQVTWIDENPAQNPCPRLLVSLSAYDYNASASLDCSERPAGGHVPFLHRTPTTAISVEADEARALKTTLEGAAFWNGPIMGGATKTSGALDRLEISSGARRAIIVTSGNPSFNEPGVRKDLMARLQKIKERLNKLQTRTANAQTTQSLTGQAQASDGVEVTLVNEAYWGGPCRLSVALGSGAQKASIDCSSPSDKAGFVPFSPLQTTAGTRALTADEVTRLWAHLQNPELWNGSILGDDTRALDGGFVRLETRAGDQRGIVVVSGNPSFTSGFRKDLLSLLHSIQDQMRLDFREAGNPASR